MNSDFYQVSELNQFIKDVLRSGFPQPVWVCGEVQGYDRNKNRTHVFFELIEKDSKSQEIVAKIGLVIFAGKKYMIQNLLRAAGNDFSMRDDLEMKFLCSVDFYGPQGAVRLIVENVDPTYTLGKLAQEKQKLIAELQKEGVLAKNKKQEVPLVPLKIGLITADDSAAYNDVLSEFERSGFGFQIYLRNALMQGKRAEIDIAKAIEDLNAIEDLDLILLTRGGGALADLSCFDSRLIAEAIAESRLAVFCGIGHEINLSIADMAAHTYAKTPTAVAQILVAHVESFLEQMKNFSDKIFEKSLDVLNNHRENLKESAWGLQSQTVEYLKEHQIQLRQLKDKIKENPILFLTTLKEKLIDLQEELLRYSQDYVFDQKAQLKQYQKLIDFVHPQNVLKRGFTLTRRKDGQILKRKSDFKNDQAIITEFLDGKIESQII